MENDRVNVGLLWHSFRSGNLGVGALTLANLAIVAEAAESCGLTAEFTIIGMADSGPIYAGAPVAQAVMINGRSLLSPSGSLAAMARQDCVLDIGGGDSFAEIYGFKRFFFLWLTKVHVWLANKPLMLSPQTIGPFGRQPYVWLARFVLEKARLVVARDQLSLDALRVVAPKAKHALSVDVAFALPYQDQSHLRDGPRLRLGLNVSGLLFNEAISGRNRFGLEVDYASLVRRFLADLGRDPGIEVHLISHVVDPKNTWDNDGVIADMLAKEFPSVVRVPDFDGPISAKSYISGLDFLVAGRMHACIAAYSSGVPVVPVAYSRKFAGLFGMLGYEHIIPTRGMNDDQSLAYLHARISDRRSISAGIVEGMKKVGAMLDVYRAELRALFQSLAHARR